jgi:pimeloyl-ACP methyl ester carboxylesterase
MPFIIVNGKRLHYADTKPEAPDATYTIIFVHGLGSTQNYFFPILPHLTDYRCITFDNYGAGRSKFDSQSHSIETIGQDVLGILDHLKVPKAVVVGYSMGGMLPTYLAATVPERVVAAVCIGPVNPSPAVAEVFQKRIPAVREGGMEAMADTIPGAATGSRATPLHRAFVREMLMAQEVEGYVANCRAIGEFCCHFILSLEDWEALCLLSLSLVDPGSGGSGVGLKPLRCFNRLPCSDAVDVTC